MVSPPINLSAPAGFRGLDPDLPIHVYHRHLPHWRQSGATYFVTFRQTDSLPQSQLRALQRWRRLWEAEHPEPRSANQWNEFARDITTKTDRYLDQGYGSCVLNEPSHAKQMLDSLFFHQGTKCRTSCCVVMPNHVHVVIKPLGDSKLESILGDIKRYVANKINRQRGQCGPLWEEESYDRIIRDEEHLYRVIQYIGNNAFRAGLTDSNWRRWISPEWDDQGWGFRDP